jgi:hypothetical protein
MFSSLMPERSPADPYAPYGQAQFRPDASVGDLRLRDITNMAADALRSVLQEGLTLLNGASESEHEPRWPDEPQRTRRGEPYEGPPDFADHPRYGEPRRTR